MDSVKTVICTAGKSQRIWTRVPLPESRPDVCLCNLLQLFKYWKAINRGRFLNSKIELIFRRHMPLLIGNGMITTVFKKNYSIKQPKIQSLIYVIYLKLNSSTATLHWNKYMGAVYLQKDLFYCPASSEIYTVWPDSRTSLVTYISVLTFLGCS